MIEINKESIKNRDIDPSDIFTRSEITTECIELEQGIIAGIQEAKDLLFKCNPRDCPCKYKGRSNHCRIFNHLYPKVPTYSIYDLRGIDQAKEVLIDLVDNRYFGLDSIPDDFELNVKKENQKWVSHLKT